METEDASYESVSSWATSLSEAALSSDEISPDSYDQIILLASNILSAAKAVSLPHTSLTYLLQVDNYSIPSLMSYDTDPCVHHCLHSRRSILRLYSVPTR